MIGKSETQESKQIEKSKMVSMPVESMELLKDNVQKEAEEIIHCVIPIKILELNVQYMKLMENRKKVQTKCNQLNVLVVGDEIKEDLSMENTDSKVSGSKKQKRGQEQIKTTSKKKRNFSEMSKDDIAVEWKAKAQVLFDEIKKELQQMTEIVEPELRQSHFIYKLASAAIEDGNNFGVAVQEEVKKLVGDASANAYNFLREMPKYHTQRSDIETKLCKYPNLRDYYKVLIDLDNKQALLLLHTLKDLRNNFFIILDTLHKNFQKIVQPKGHKPATMSLY
ncbi:Proteasome activator pa28 beta subunit family protein [Reticulomyxa filosa]|uniref:Proteasome activator pa28 beta subunit family protein n=1 Tax=Reticulomyxa filosa TaxID=46433 RepID=X6NEA6_RETFI|nr:Proteasome activator pa28 beta subunit family protein [Reticulomyxa filosa]|eukprot:ETO24223.1 Proteasome activator pa28 beta subunit family protein [Reticulomyxa filosa]